MAQNASKEIRELAVARRGVVGMLAGQVALEPRLVTGWHKEVVTVLAYTRMWREVADLNFEPGFATPGVAFDFTPNELDKAGLHASREALEGDLAETGVAWPQTTERPDWYEGESIYLRVERPARAPRSFQNNYAEFFGIPFQAEDYASVVPRLKPEVLNET